MATYSVTAIAGTNITIDGGATALSGGDDASHLLGSTLVLDAASFEAISIDDSDPNFEDSDGSQKLTPGQTVFGVVGGSNRAIEAEWQVTLEDADGNTYTMVGINIREDGANSNSTTVEGVTFVGTVPPTGVTLTVIATADGPEGTETPYEDYAPPCFADGTLIQGADGPVAVESLSVGDEVMTLDHGLQPLLWVGHMVPSLKERAVKIARGALGHGPSDDLIVSPQHRMLIRSDLAGLWFDAPECLVAAKHLVGRPGVTTAPRPHRYTHLLFERHEVIFANGSPTESLLPGAVALRGLTAADRADVLCLLPGLPHAKTPARPILKAWEARLLAA